MAAAPKADPKVVDPHLVDEDPEEHLGAEILDPWVDPTQLDWPNNEVDENGESEEEVAE